MDTRLTNSIGVLCCASSTATNPQLCVDGHVPDIGVALVMSGLDYGNSVLIGLPIHLIRRLQSVQNAAARLICKLRRFDHITDAPISLHWLHIPGRIVYMKAVVIFKVLHGTAPEYPGPAVVRVADLFG